VLAVRHLGGSTFPAKKRGSPRLAPGGLSYPLLEVGGAGRRRSRDHRASHAVDCRSSDDWWYRRYHPAGCRGPSYPLLRFCGRHLTFSQILASTARTDAANHLLPLAVGISRSLRALAMARSEVAPLACSSVIMSAARAAAASALASAPFWRAFAVSLAPAPAVQIALNRSLLRLDPQA
jgi:hypothetical protein